MAETATTAADDAASLRRRAQSLEVIGVPTPDRRLAHRRRMGLGLLAALYLGQGALRDAASPTVEFHAALGRFVLIFVATLMATKMLGDLYDRFSTPIVDGTATDEVATDQHPPEDQEGLGSDQ